MTPTEKDDLKKKLLRTKAFVGRAILALEVEDRLGNDTEGLYWRSYITTALDELETINLEYC